MKGRESEKGGDGMAEVETGFSGTGKSLLEKSIRVMSLKQRQTKRHPSSNLILPPVPSDPLLTQVTSPKPPNLRSTPNGKSSLRTTLSGNTVKSQGALKPKKSQLELIPERKEPRTMQRLHRPISPLTCDANQLQHEITLATQSALKSVENFHSKKNADCFPIRYSPLSTQRTSSPHCLEKESDEDCGLGDTEVSPITGRDKTPTKRDIDGFFRASMKYGDGIGNILRKANEGLEETWEKPMRKSLLLHLDRPRRSETPLPVGQSLSPHLHAMAKAQCVLQTLKRTNNA